MRDYSWNGGYRPGHEPAWTRCCVCGKAFTMLADEVTGVADLCSDACADAARKEDATRT